MQLRFGPGDDDAFITTRDALLDDFGTSLAAGAPDEFVAHATLLFHWQFQRSEQIDLTTLTTADLDDFFFRWLPAKYSGRADEAPDICRAVASFIQFMHRTGRLNGGLDTLAELMMHCDRAHDEVVDVMRDPANFGLTKSILTAPTGSAGIDLQALLNDPNVDVEQLQSALTDQMEAFNSLSFEERRAATDPAFERRDEPIQLPIVHTPPSNAEVAASAVQSELWHLVVAFVREVGTKGVALTQAGYVKPAEAIRISVAINTPDVSRFVDFDDAQRYLDETTSARDLPWFAYIEALAQEVDALRWLKTKVKANPAWLDEVDADPTHVAAQVAELAAGSGALSPILADTSMFRPQIASFLDDGLPHILTYALPAGAEIEIDRFVSLVLDNARAGFLLDTSFLPDHDGRQADAIIDDYFLSFEHLRIAGLVAVRDRNEFERHGLRHYEGGWCSMTPLGRHLFAPIIRTVGYQFAERADLSTADARTVINALATDSLDVDELVAAWQPDRPADDRVSQLTDSLMDETIGAQRLAAFGLIRTIDGGGMAGAAPTVDELMLRRIGQHVRSLLDSNAAGHAATYLLDRQLAQPDDVAAFITIDSFIDILSGALGDEEQLVELFVHAQQQSDVDLLDDMWRCEIEETRDVLEAIGRSTVHKKMAKEARRALHRRSSWLMNR